MKPQQTIIEPVITFAQTFFGQITIALIVGIVGGVGSLLGKKLYRKYISKRKKK